MARSYQCVNAAVPEVTMRNIIFLSLVAGTLTGCYTYSEKEWVARQNADPCVWPPVVEGQPFPVQRMCGDSRK